MAGYIFNLDSLTSLKAYAANGIYATKLSTPEGAWKIHHEGTFADYVTMQPGDNIYFFIQRKIYGIGELIAVGDDCKYFNFPGAGAPIPGDYTNLKDKLLWDESSFSADQRCVCLFKPAPHFFRVGIDMDDVLSSRPAAFKMLRAFWKVSFLKFDDEENQAFRDVILKHNRLALSNPDPTENIFPTHFEENHVKVEKRLGQDDYTMNITPVLAGCAYGNILNHEMAVELGLLQQLTVKEPRTVSLFGEWDYLSHQVVASPFKPVDYMDKMDVFGYSFIPGYQPTRSDYLVVELKKDVARMEHLEQLMKYVDWVNSEYAFGDYSMIHAYLIASDFDEHVINAREVIGNRKFTHGMRPAVSTEWKNLKLVKYFFRNNGLEFTEVKHPPRTLFSREEPESVH